MADFWNNLTPEEKLAAAQARKDRTAATRGYVAIIAQGITEVFGKVLGERLAITAEGITEVFGKVLGERFGMTDKRMAELEQRIGAMETRKGLTYRSQWRSDVAYGRDDAVTHGGSLFVCMTQGTCSKPGASDDWRLASKRDLQ